jgi:hypothetical protein
MSRVRKVGQDWIAECREHRNHPEEYVIFCWGWLGAMEAIWGHLAMHGCMGTGKGAPWQS